MFSPKLTQEKLLSLSRSGRTLTAYPIDFCRDAVKHFETITERDANNKPLRWKRPLTPEELQFVENEQLYTQISFDYWARRYFPVADAETLKYNQFSPNKGQQFLFSLMAEMEEKNLPMLFMLLKVRQMGGTTVAQGVNLHAMTRLENINAIVASSDPDKSAKMLNDKFITPLEKLPFFLLPPGMSWVDSGELRVWCDRTNVKLTLAHGKSREDMGRGDTFNRIHGSEVRDWDRPRRHIHDSVIPAVHLSSETFGIYESTARGRGNDWHGMWIEAKEGWPLRRSKICPVFIPPYLAQDIYPTDGWLRLIPIPPDWKPQPATLAYASQGEAYIQQSPILRALFPDGYRIPARHLWWYEFEYTEALRNDRLGEWMAEHPPTDLSAFQSAARSIFSPILISEYDNSLKQPKGVFTISGSEILSDWTCDKTEWAGERFRPINIKHQVKEMEYEWWLQPLRFPGYNETSNPLNRLYIWEWPESNHEYCVSLDTAGGEEKDRTVLQVIRKATSDSRPVQCAEFASDTIGGLEIWPIWFLLLKMYSVRSSSGLNFAQAAPEMNFDGPAALQQIMNLGWSNVYIRKENEKAEQNYTTRSLLGFKTTAGTRPLLVGWLIKFLKAQQLQINSPWLVDEMRGFVRKINPTTGKVRIEHDNSEHDDRLFSLAIGLISLHDLDIYGSESPNWRDVNSQRERLAEFATVSDSGLTIKAKELLDLFRAEKDNELGLSPDDPVPAEIDSMRSDLREWANLANQVELDEGLAEFSTYQDYRI